MSLCHNPGYHRFKPRLPSCRGNKIIHTTQHKKASVAKLSCLFYFVPLTMSKLWSHLLFQQGWFNFLQAMARPHHYFLTMKAEENKILTITHLSLTFPLSLSFFCFSLCQFWVLWKLSYTFNYPEQQRPHKWDQKLSKQWHCAWQLENYLVSLSLSLGSLTLAGLFCVSNLWWATMCARRDWRNRNEKMLLLLFFLWAAALI